MFIKIGTVNCDVAFTAEAGPTPDSCGMYAQKIRSCMASDTQIGVSRCEHFIIDRAMDLVAGGTTFAKRQMFISKRSALLFVALKTLLIHIIHGCGRPRPGFRAMRIVAIGAGHMPFENGMAIGKTELGFLIHVAGEAHFGVLAGIDDLVAFAAAGFCVEASGAVAHLATFHFDAFHRDGDTFVGGELEILDLFFMAGAAGLGADIRGSFHLMVFHDSLESFNVDVAAGGKSEGTSKD